MIDYIYLAKFIIIAVSVSITFALIKMLYQILTGRQDSDVENNEKYRFIDVLSEDMASLLTRIVILIIITLLIFLWFKYLLQNNVLSNAVTTSIFIIMVLIGYLMSSKVYRTDDQISFDDHKRTNLLNDHNNVHILDFLLVNLLFISANIIGFYFIFGSYRNILPTEIIVFGLNLGLFTFWFKDLYASRS